MATTPLQTPQSNIKNSNKDWTQYSLFLGGLDVTNPSLQQYDPLRVGYARLFVVKKPVFLDKLMAGTASVEKKKFNSFWHMLEYGFIGVDGIQNTNMDFEAITGGYAGRSFEIPSIAKDDTNAITIRVYEMAGSPIREMIDLWITGIADPYTGLTHYHGLLQDTSIVPVCQANQSAEMIYVQTDSTGNSNNIEYACLLTNMVPKSVKKDHFNYESGTHPLVQTDIEFTTTKYESAQINLVAKALVAKHNILSNYTYFRASDYLDSNNNVKPAISGRPDEYSADWATNPKAKTA
jgi:hypothetical protein